MKLFTRYFSAAGKRNQFFLLGSLALLVWIYVILRAVFVAITWDEAYCFMQTVVPGKIIPDHFDVMAANNHYLNTFFMWLSWKAFGAGEFALRVPALIFCGIYLFYVLRFLMELRSRVAVLFGFALLCLNPFVIDFLSLARGYGMAMALMMIALWRLHVYVSKDRKTKHLFFGLLWAGMSVAANLSWLYFFMAYAGTAFLLIATQTWPPKRIERFKTLAAVFFPAVLFILPALWLGLQYAKAKALDYGSTDGLWNGTLSSLMDGFFYRSSHQHVAWMSMRMFVRIGIGLALLAALRHCLRVGWNNWSKSFLTVNLLMFLFFIVLVLLQHELLGTKFIQGRTALSLQVLFAVLLVFVFDRLPPNGISKMASLVPAALFTVHFICCINFHHTYEWQSGSVVNNGLARMEEELAKTGRGKLSPVLIGTDLDFIASIMYRQRLNELPWIRDFRAEPNFYDPDLRFAPISKRNFFRMKALPDWKNIAYYADDGAALFMNTAWKP